MTKSQNKNAFENIKNFINPEYMANAMKNTAAPNFTHFTESCKKNADAVTSATQMVTESMHALVRRSAEMIQSQMTESFEAMKDITSSSNPEQVAARQQEFLRNTMENTMSGFKEIMDIATKSTMEIFETTGKKMNQNFEDCASDIKKNAAI